MLRDNIIKVGIGFVFGSILLFFIQDLHFIIISLIQMFFFTVLYSSIDRIIKKVRKDGLR